jgi:hypothetical protein
MDTKLRRAFNGAYTDDLYARYRKILDDSIGPFPFRVAETPLFLDSRLQKHLEKAALEIIAQLSDETKLAKMRKAIPDHYDAPGMSALPDCVQVDFGLCKGENGEIVGRVVELQAFPSLSAMEIVEADAWDAVFRDVPALRADYTCFFSGDREDAMQLLRGCILGPYGAEDTVLVDIEPETQKTAPDFRATKKLLGIDSICVSAIKKDGRTLLRDKGGRWVPIRRIYNRLVFDELERKKIEPPWKWTDDLDVSWCSHPNWYWVWSKFSLPHVDHECVPKAHYVSDLSRPPDDLENWVLKPLFSFAGAGVVIDVTKEALDAIPDERRPHYLLQRKVEYAHAIEAPDGAGVKAEVRMMMLRRGKGKPLEALLPLVRLSRGKMLGVDQNRAAESMWTGGSVGIWPL